MRKVYARVSFPSDEAEGLWKAKREAECRKEKHEIGDFLEFEVLNVEAPRRRFSYGSVKCGIETVRLQKYVVILRFFLSLR